MSAKTQPQAPELVGDRAHGDLLAVDPSVDNPGAALYRFGKLIACGKVRVPPELAALPDAARWLRVGMEIAGWWQDRCEGDNYHVRTVVYEKPQIYTDGKGKGNPNLLLGLVGVGQSVAVLLSAMNGHDDVRPPELLSPTPAEWTGQLPKSTRGNPWNSPRGQRINGCLHDVERPLVPAQHDSIDAAGIGLWALGRYGGVRGTHRVMPGAV